jgi:hypothetical protein
VDFLRVWFPVIFDGHQEARKSAVKLFEWLLSEKNVLHPYIYTLAWDVALIFGGRCIGVRGGNRWFYVVN